MKTRIGLPDYTTVERMMSLPATGKIMYGLDHVSLDPSYIYLNGWAALEKSRCNKCEDL